MNASHARGEAKSTATFDLDTDIRRLFTDHVYGTFIEDQAALRLLDIIGEDNVMLECDYPHSDSTWPDTIHVARLPASGAVHVTAALSRAAALGMALSPTADVRAYPYT
jgi:hypothetical protein